MKDFDSKKKIIMIVVSSLLLVIGVTFAYFINKSNKEASANVNIRSDSLDKLTFNVDKDISLNPNQFNFASGAGSLTDNAVASANLKASSLGNKASYNYYVYLNITNNEFIYTTSDSKPEIILTVTDPTGAEVKSIDGLTYYQNIKINDTNTINGFDVTTKTGLIEIANKYEISTTSEVKQEWNITLTFVNLDSDQSKNSQKNLDGVVIIQENVVYDSIAAACTGKEMGSCIAENYISDSSIYYHDSKLENGAGDNSYRYAGASDSVNNFVCFGSNADTCPNNNLYRIIGVLDDQVKLIKYDYATKDMLGTDSSYYTSYDADSFSGESKGENALEDISQYFRGYDTAWSASKLNTLSLNTNYINYLGTDWTSKIATHTWIVGGNTADNIYEVPVATTYKNEIVSPASNTTYDAKVGLMYASDFGFATSQSTWTSNLIDINLNNSDLNWMFMGVDEHTIIYSLSESLPIIIVSSIEKDMSYRDFVAILKRWGDWPSTLRPVFYLNNDVKLASGTGTISDPYRIEV